MTHTTMRAPMWRKHGKSVAKAMTAQDAIKMGNLDFTVKVSDNPVGAVVDGEVLAVNDKFITYSEYPDGKMEALGVVGNRYTPIQNHDAFDLLNNIVDESGAIFDHAGRVGNGERCWISMKMPENIVVANGQDELETYMTCINSHDGSSSFRIYTSFLRLICTNGLTRETKGSEITLRHTVNSIIKVQEAREALQLVFAEQAEFENEINAMLGIKMTDKDYKNFVESLLPVVPEDATLRKQNSVEETRSELLGLWKAPTQQPVANTAWAAYNAVAEYVDWFKPVRKTETMKSTNRLIGESLMKNRARELLLA